MEEVKNDKSKKKSTENPAMSLKEILSSIKNRKGRRGKARLDPPETNIPSDCESVNDDDDFDDLTYSLNQLPKSILLVDLLTKSKKENKESPLKKRKVASKTASVDNGRTDADIPTFETPAQCLQAFWTDEWIEDICDQSRLYAKQHSLSADCITAANIRMFFGILLYSGYQRMPHRRMYWETADDVRDNAASKTMRRDTFDKILRTIHFADDSKKDNDKFFKVRPIFEHLNKVCLLNKVPDLCLVDDIMANVDLFDHFVSSYNTSITCKRWWWKIFTWCLSAQTVCAWRLYRSKKLISLLEFNRKVVINYMENYGIQRIKTGPQVKGVDWSVKRFNEGSHWSVKSDKLHAYCRHCPSRTRYKCKECDVPLHPLCMQDYHTKK